MGALYYWAFRLGGPEWGPFSAWISGWTNLLGQIAGVASGGYAGATVIANLVSLTTEADISPASVLGIYAAVLTLAGVVNTYAETLLTSLCYCSVVVHIFGTIIMVTSMLCTSPKLQTASFVFGEFNNSTGFDSVYYVALIGALAAASTFTGYDTAAHVSEETTTSHTGTPRAMWFSVFTVMVLGLLMIIGFNFTIQDLDELTADADGGDNAYVVMWLESVGYNAAVAFQVILFVAIECSNCANLTSASRMVYSLSRDGGMPLSSIWYKMDEYSGGPTRAIWLCVVVAFIMGIPGISNPTVLSALFSLTATGLYTSYAIPILLRITIGRDKFVQAEWNLGNWSIPIGIVSVTWCCFMTAVLCLPQATPTTQDNLNYSPVALGLVLFVAIFVWNVSAKYWFKGAKTYTNTNASECSTLTPSETLELHAVLREDAAEGEIEFRKHPTLAKATL